MGNRVKIALCVIGAIPALCAAAICWTWISAPSRLRAGQDVVLIAHDDEYSHHEVCLVAENPHEALFVREWHGGTVVSDDGSALAVDRGVVVRLDGPEVYGWSFRDDGDPLNHEKYSITLRGDRLLVRVGRSEVMPVQEALARRDAKRPGRKQAMEPPVAREERSWEPPPGSWDEAREKTKRTWLLPPGTCVVVQPTDGEGAELVYEDTGRSRRVKAGVQAVVVEDPEAKESNFDAGRPVKIRLGDPPREGWVDRRELLQPN